MRDLSRVSPKQTLPGAWSNDLYELFINHLRHPYAVSPMLPASMIDPNQTESGLLSQRNVGCQNNRVDEQMQPEEDDMKALAFTQISTPLRANSQPASHRLLAKMQVVGVVIGLGGGVGSGLLGALLIAAGWLTGNSDAQHWLSTAGSALLFLTIPLIILSAFCLDWIEKREPRGISKAMRFDDEQ